MFLNNSLNFCCFDDINVKKRKMRKQLRKSKTGELVGVGSSTQLLGMDKPSRLFRLLGAAVALRANQ